MELSRIMKHGVARLGLAVVALACASSALGQAIDESRPKMPMQWLMTFHVARPALHDRSTWTAEENALARAHGEYLQQLANRGSVVFGGRTYDVDNSGKMQPDTIGAVVFETPDRASVEALIAADPAFKRGLFTYKLQSFAILVKR